MNLKKNKGMVAFIFIVIGSLITIFAAFFEYRSKIAEKNEEIEKERQRAIEYENLIKNTNNIIQNNNHIIESQRKVIDTTHKIIELQNELNDKNLQIQNLQNNTLNTLTGGKSVPQLDITIAGGVSIFVKVINNSKYPIRNVSVEFDRLVMDYMEPEVAGPERKTTNPDVHRTFKFELNDIPILSDKPFYNEVFIRRYNEFRYLYTVRWQNGFYTGVFVVKDGLKENYIISDTEIFNFSNGFNLEKAVSINGKFSSIHSK